MIVRVETRKVTMLHMQLARLNRMIFSQPYTSVSVFVLYQFIRNLLTFIRIV